MHKKLPSPLREALRELPPPPIDEEHRTATVRAAGLAYQNRRRQPSIGFRAFLLRQIRFIALPMWLLQGAVVLLLFLGLQLVFEGDWTYVMGRPLPLVLGCFAVLTAGTGLPFLGRSAQYHMLEVELASRLSLRRLFLARLLIIGSGEALALALGLLLAAMDTDFSFGHLLVSALLPFFVASLGCLAVQSCGNGAWGLQHAAAFCGFLFVLLPVLYKINPQLFAAGHADIWGILSLISGLLLAAKAFRLWKKSSSLQGLPS